MTVKNKKAAPLKTRKLTYTAMYLAIALALPFITGQIPEIGAMLSPMHIPVLLCGFMCGWPWGMAVGLAAPLLRGMLFGMPPIFPTGIAMTFELAAYGALSGFLYLALHKKTWSIFVSLVVAMIVGRLIYSAVHLILTGVVGTGSVAAILFAGAVDTAVNTLPGIIMQLILIPPLVIAMDRTGLSLNGK